MFMLPNWTQQHEVADVERLRYLAELLRHLVRAADQHVAAVDDAFHVLGRAGEALLRALAERAVAVRAACATWLCRPARCVASVM